MPTLLTKSKYVIGLQCPKYLWMMFNSPGSIPGVDEATQFLFDQGHEVGNLAKKWFPQGLDISSSDFMRNIRQTQELLKRRLPLFEAGFIAGNLFSRIDILNPIGADEWDIIEVKSSTEIKDEHYHDVSFQKHCCEKSGLKIRNCFLMHINNEYIKHGNIDPKSILKQEKITDEIIEAAKGIQERIKLMFNIINSKEMPKQGISKQCNEPYECPLKEQCWKFLPESNVFHLYRSGKNSFELFNKGIVSIADIPDEMKLTDKQELQRECEKNSKIHIHKEKIRHFLKTLIPPLYYMDFETFQFAIPKYDGTRPYQQIPFQFSVHMIKEDKSKEYLSFLAEGSSDPRPKFAEALKKAIAEKGTIIVYNQAFEIARLKELEQAFPENKEWIENALTRIIDLLVPFRDFAYYNPKQQGSCSIKQVLPAITGKSYEGMNISSGDNASLSFIKIAFHRMDEDKRKMIRKDLLDYCGLDTEGMVWIVEELKKLAE